MPLLKHLFLIVLIVSPTVVYSESFLDKMKASVKMALCLEKKTETMCTYEAMLEMGTSNGLKKDEIKSGQSQQYVLTMPNANWLHMYPEQKRQEDLVLMESSGHAVIQVDWFAGTGGDYKAAAREELKDLIDALESEPTDVALDIWPFKENGVFYEMCYNTDKETVECMYSAVANIPGGMVQIFAHAEAEDKYIEDIVNIIASIDIPATK